VLGRKAEGGEFMDIALRAHGMEYLQPEPTWTLDLGLGLVAAALCFAKGLCSSAIGCPYSACAPFVMVWWMVGYPPGGLLRRGICAQGAACDWAARGMRACGVSVHAHVRARDLSVQPVQYI
jgi:hypothetical protein